MTSAGISSATSVVSCARHERGSPHCGQGRSASGTGIGFFTRRKFAGNARRTAGCFGGALRSGLPPFCSAASASLRSASDRSPPDCSRSSFVKSASCSAEMCSPRLRLSRILASSISSSRLRDTSAATTASTSSVRPSPRSSRTTSSGAPRSSLLPDVFLSSPLTPHHKTIPTIPVNASTTRFLRFRQPVARDGGSHRVALRADLRSSPSRSIDSSCASISTRVVAVPTRSGNVKRPRSNRLCTIV